MEQARKGKDPVPDADSVAAKASRQTRRPTRRLNNRRRSSDAAEALVSDRDAVVEEDDRTR
jgi:hypothetical protein